MPVRSPDRPYGPGLESDVENLLSPAFGSLVDISQNVRHVVGAMRDSAAGSTEELLIVSGTFDLAGCDVGKSIGETSMKLGADWVVERAGRLPNTANLDQMRGE